ncbi:MAG: LysR family transcriptional regulator [Devosia sp.]
MNLASIELKLLVVFDAMLAERSVTRVGYRLGMSQPAVSNALNRLRDLLKDQLFLRTGEGMVPTPRALELGEPLQQALRQIERALEPAAFQPRELDWTFNLAVSDYVSVVFLPALIAHMNTVAPAVKLHIQSKRNPEVSGLLDNSEADLAIGIIPDLPRRFRRAQLFRDRYVCMMRVDHPLAGSPISLADFQAIDHLAIKPSAHEISRADRLLHKQGVRRKIATTAQQLLAAPAIVSRSDLVVLVFERVVDYFDREAFFFCPAPVDDMWFRVSAVWNQAHNEDAAAKWLRRQVIEVASRMEPPEDARPARAALPLPRRRARVDVAG